MKKDTVLLLVGGFFVASWLSKGAFAKTIGEAIGGGAVGIAKGVVKETGEAIGALGAEVASDARAVSDAIQKKVDAVEADVWEDITGVSDAIQDKVDNVEDAVKKALGMEQEAPTPVCMGTSTGDPLVTFDSGFESAFRQQSVLGPLIEEPPAEEKDWIAEYKEDIVWIDKWNGWAWKTEVYAFEGSGYMYYNTKNFEARWFGDKNAAIKYWTGRADPDSVVMHITYLPQYKDGEFDTFRMGIAIIKQHGRTIGVLNERIRNWLKRADASPTKEVKGWFGPYPKSQRLARSKPEHRP